MLRREDTVAESRYKSINITIIYNGWNWTICRPCILLCGSRLSGARVLGYATSSG